MKRVIFLDRDGTLIKEPPDNYQVDRIDKLEFLPGVISNLARLQKEIDAVWVMITNQDGLGTESFPEDDFWPPHQMMMNIFENEGISFNEVLIDRTFKHENAPTRKPGTGLVRHYLNGSYDLKNSIVVGDRPSDIKLAQNMGAKGIMIGKSLDTQDDNVGDIEETLIAKVENWEDLRTTLLTIVNGSRKGEVSRKTNETEITVGIDLDGSGAFGIHTGIGFFDHMLEQLSRHSGVDMDIQVQGDLHIDPHHSIEDTGLALGRAFKMAMGNKAGMNRYGWALLAMDESLAQVALDFSGRPYLVWKGILQREKVGEMPTEMVQHFFKSFCDASGCTMNIQFEGQNDHHMIEAIFKGVAKAIGKAVSIIEEGGEIPSTKGIL